MEAAQPGYRTKNRATEQTRWHIGTKRCQYGYRQHSVKTEDNHSTDLVGKFVHAERLFWCQPYMPGASIDLFNQPLD
jgi:hypothetical protein